MPTKKLPYRSSNWVDVLIGKIQYRDTATLISVYVTTIFSGTAHYFGLQSCKNDERLMHRADFDTLT